METSLTHIGHAFRWVVIHYQHFTGVTIMKFSLAALVLACAVASPAFAGFDIPPMVPPHSFDIPPMIPPHLAVLVAVPGSTFDIPPMVPPHAAALQQNA
jgi:hypothetical protein